MEGDNIVSDDKQAVSASVAPNTGFGCVYCGKFFTQNSSLTYHIRTVHRKIKDIFCEICAKAIINSGIKHVLYLKKYPHGNGINILESAGIEVSSLCE